jgi:hypothetical protein
MTSLAGLAERAEVKSQNNRGLSLIIFCRYVPIFPREMTSHSYGRFDHMIKVIYCAYQVVGV